MPPEHGTAGRPLQHAHQTFPPISASPSIRAMLLAQAHPPMAGPCSSPWPRLNLPASQLLPCRVACTEKKTCHEEAAASVAAGRMKLGSSRSSGSSQPTPQPSKRRLTCRFTLMPGGAWYECPSPSHGRSARARSPAGTSLLRSPGHPQPGLRRGSYRQPGLLYASHVSSLQATKPISECKHYF